MDSRPTFFVIVYKVHDGRWVRYGEREFDHRMRADAHLSALQREYPKRNFAVRQKRWRGKVHQPAS